MERSGGVASEGRFGSEERGGDGWRKGTEVQREDKGRGERCIGRSRLGRACAPSGALLGRNTQRTRVGPRGPERGLAQRRGCVERGRGRRGTRRGEFRGEEVEQRRLFFDQQDRAAKGRGAFGGNKEPAAIQGQEWRLAERDRAGGRTGREGRGGGRCRTRSSNGGAGRGEGRAGTRKAGLAERSTELCAPRKAAEPFHEERRARGETVREGHRLVRVRGEKRREEGRGRRGRRRKRVCAITVWGENAQTRHGYDNERQTGGGGKGKTKDAPAARAEERTTRTTVGRRQPSPALCCGRPRKGSVAMGASLERAGSGGGGREPRPPRGAQVEEEQKWRGKAGLERKTKEPERL